MTPGFNDSAIFGGGLVAPAGGAAPGAGVVYGSFGSPDFTGPVAINSSGQVANFAFLAGAGVNTGNSRAIYRDGTLIARTGDAAPGACPSVFHDYFDTQWVNNVGQVAFNSLLTGSGITAVNASALYRGAILIARKGDAASFLGAGVSWQALGAPLLNHTGQVAFKGAVPGASVTDTNDWGLFIGDGSQIIKAVRERNALAFSTVVDFSVIEEGNGMAFSSYGQVAYSANLANGKSGVFVFTPDLHWRSAVGGDWSDAAHWTVGLAPAVVHDVFIDPTISLTVNGPAGTHTVRSLTLGGGHSGITTLSGGTVRVQDLTLPGGLVNHGLVHGSGILRTHLVNHSDGELEVATGETLRLEGTSHDNAGRIEIVRGSLQVSGELHNQPGSGVVFGRDATLRFTDGLVNFGTLLFNQGDASLILGKVSNRPGGEFTTQGNGNVLSLFGDLVNAGNLYTGNGATTRLMGDVSGPGSFTGPGTVQFDGNVSLGSSPALISFGGSVVLHSTSRTVMELAGSARGTGYDAFDATGALTLGGTLQVDLLPDFSSHAGQDFDLFAAPVLAGHFAGLDLPVLGAGLVWQGALLVDASGDTDIWRLRISTVPEPHPGALWLGGWVMLAAWRRRAAVCGRSATCHPPQGG